MDAISYLLLFQVIILYNSVECKKSNLEILDNHKNIFPKHFRELRPDRILTEYNYYKKNGIWSERVILEIFYHSIIFKKGVCDYNCLEEIWLDESIDICDWCGITCGAEIQQQMLNSDSDEIIYGEDSGYEDKFDVRGSCSKSLVWNRGKDNFPADDANSSVVAIDMVDMDFVGTLPKELSQLRHLRRLNLGCNRLRGTIPESFGQWKHLEVLGLNSNQLTGSIPKTIGNLKNLIFIHLEKNGLRGTMLGNKSDVFPHLETVDLSSNKLSSTIHEKLSENAPSLRLLYLDSNRLTGTIPEKLFATSKKLHSVYLSDNKLSGTIPTEFASKNIIENIMLAKNKLRGAFPKKLLLFPKLNSLGLSGNKLTGLLPFHMPQLEKIDSSLMYLSLQNNDLRGPIAWNIFVHFRYLETLSLGRNSFTGTIPNAIADYFYSLIELDVSYNQLSGVLPTELANIPSLLVLNVTGNHITGEIPLELCDHPYLNLENTAEFGCDAILCPRETFHMNGAASSYGGCRKCILYADEDPGTHIASTYLGQTTCENTNFMIGDIDSDGLLSPREILRLLYSATNGSWGPKYVSWKSKIPECQLPGVSCKKGKVSKIELVDADLCGGLPEKETSYDSYFEMACFLPSELGYLQSLQSIKLFDMPNLKSKIPTELGLLPNLKSLNISSCPSIIGSIPSELGDIPTLRYLILDNTSVSGSIPPALGLLKNLEGLGLGFTSLTGTIPTELGMLEKIENMHLPHAGLKGSIPSTFSKLCKTLDNLEIYDNQLIGPLPNLSSCSLLRELDVFGNKLSSTLPDWLGNLESIEILHLKGNKFNGTIPSSLGTLPNLGWLNVGNNRLTGSIPSSLANITSLREIYLSGNMLKGDVPKSLCENLLLNEESNAPGCESIACPVGTYTVDDETRILSCKLCPTGQTTLYTGSYHCVEYTQKDFLVMLYEFLDGGAWSDEFSNGWKQNEDECNWAGVSCDEDGIIDGLTIPLAGLRYN